MKTYDDAAFEQFCSGLVNDGFSPIHGTGQRRWTGPIRESLKPLTDAARMQIVFYDGWPLRYAHVLVSGLKEEHAGNGIVCLWAEDDPAQVAGRKLGVLWRRLDEWAQAAQRGFGDDDRALDAYLLYERRENLRAELPFSDLIRSGSNGYRASMTATMKAGLTLMIEPEREKASDDVAQKPLKGAFYLRGNVAAPPRNFDELRALLTKKQKLDLDRGLGARSSVAIAEPSGGYDFIILAWPRHGREHDAVVIAFAGNEESLQHFAIAATPNDMAARKKRAGPDVAALEDKKVLIAGAGSVGGHVAVNLACSGTGTIRLQDSDTLSTANLVRHVSDKYGVGYKKVIAVSLMAQEHAPWVRIEPIADDLPHDPDALAASILGFDLVVDCTGVFSVSAALGEVCRRNNVPLIVGALFHQGALARVQRQAEGDTVIASRAANADYLTLPPEEPSDSSPGFLELGCTALVNNAPPVAVFSTAADIAHAAIDFLTGRMERPDERITVFRQMKAPFDRIGTFEPAISKEAQ